jgi:dTDP-4-amino-4,6-dideoxygalactose transaminase
MGEAEVEAAAEVLRSGWLTTGARAHAFEAAFAERLGVRHALAVSSATAALHLALEAAGVGRGDEVILPTYTFTACGEVCAYLGARPVLVDVGDDYLVRAEAIHERLTDRTRVVMPVHFAGQAVDVRDAVAGREGVRIVEDAAHALPADVAGTSTGRLGDAAAFSFYATKTMTTGGEGGMLVTDDEAIAARARTMRLHGINADAWNRYGAGGTWRYEVTDAGFKYNLTDLAASIGLVQLGRLDAMAEQRSRIAARYDSAFAGSDLVAAPPRREGDRHAWHLYVVRLRTEALAMDRGAVVARLAEAGIGASVHFIPLHLHPYYQREHCYREGDFPVAEDLYARSISLPIFPDMTDAEVDRVSATLLEICQSARQPVQV